MKAWWKENLSNGQDVEWKFWVIKEILTNSEIGTGSRLRSPNPPFSPKLENEKSTPYNIHEISNTKPDQMQTSTIINTV